MCIKNIGVIFSQPFLGLFFNSEYLAGRQANSCAKALTLGLQIRTVNPPVINMLSAIMHSQDLTNHNPFRDTQALKADLLRLFHHLEDPSSISPKPSANNSAMAVIASSSSIPSALAWSSVPRLAASIRTLRI